MKKNVFLATILCSLLLWLTTGETAVWYVDNESTCTSGCGMSWAEPFGTIQQAVDASGSEDEIWVKQGTYFLSSRIRIVSGNKFLYGGFSGSETELSQRDPQANVTTIDAQHTVTNLVVESDAGLSIDGFVVTRGVTELVVDSWDGPAPSGGGLSCDGCAALTVDNCVFIDNHEVAILGGGGVINHQVLVNNCVFIGNGGFPAGGLYLIGTVTNSTFVGNRGVHVGAINAVAQIINCTFFGNQRTLGGVGGIYDSGTVKNSILWGNTSPQIEDVDTVSYCNIDQDGYAGTNGTIRQEPLLVQDPSAGPDSTWGTADDDYGDLRLQAGSPCIDAGTSDGAPVTDLDGLYRYDAPGVPNTGGGERPYVDMGAYEYAGHPTLIELASFSAAPQSGRVVLEWVTVAEIDNAGFNIFRAESEVGEYKQINTTLIPSAGSPTEGAIYQYIDGGVQNRTTFRYLLQDVDFKGLSKLHGPVQATPRLLFGKKQ